MSTFADIKRIVSSQDKTTAIRLDDDLKLTVRTEKSGAHTDHQYNFSNVKEGQQIDTTDPIGWIQVAKDDDTEVGIIGVNVYHAENEHDTVPAEGQYWYNPSSQYWPASAAQPGKTLATDPSFKDTVQTFPQIIFNISSAGALVSGNTVGEVSIPSATIIDTRRSELKNKINLLVTDPMLPAITGFTSFAVIDQITVSGLREDLVNDYPRRLQSFWTWIEMLTRAISIDANLSSDEYYALLLGEVSLNIWSVFERLDRRSAADIRNGANSRNGWAFHGFGTVSQANPQAPWVYALPTGTTWRLVRNNNINIGSTASVTQFNWITWLRT